MHFVCVVYFEYLCSLQPHYFSNYTLIYSFPCRCLWTVDRDRKPSRINITSSCIRNSNQKNFFYYSSLTSQEETKGILLLPLSMNVNSMPKKSTAKRKGFLFPRISSSVDTKYVVHVLLMTNAIQCISTIKIYYKARLQ